MVFYFVYVYNDDEVIFMYVATSQQLKRYDQALLDEGYTIEELVDKASDCLLGHFQKYQKVMVVCGPGNNGADGISLGIKLFHQNKDVCLYLTGNMNHLSQANKYYMDQAETLGMKMVWLDESYLEDFEKIIDQYEVIVDAMFGFGLNGDLRGIVKNVVDIINNAYDIDVIAIDIPTGLNPDNGKPYNSCICASRTITLTALKLGFLNNECHIYTGDIILELLDAKNLHEDLTLAKLVEEKWAKYHLKQRKFDGHKGTYGKVLHITGCHHYIGAALLAAKAAVYTGSGIVTVCSSDRVIQSLSIFAPEATSLLRTKTVSDKDLDDKSAVLIGSGLGLNQDAYDLVLSFLQKNQKPVVIDGDALTILAKNMSLLEHHDAPWILTPHHGEFSRFADFKNTADMIDQAIAFARKYHVILVLKGPNTFITDGYEAYRNTTGNKAMSSAGMGDVLAGMITSLLGQGYSAKNAAILGVYLHGLCGDELAKKQYTVIAHQMIEEIPRQMFTLIQKS